MTEQELVRAIQETVNEQSALPDSCPWCGYRGMMGRHMSAKHPEKWQQWKDDHQKVKVNRTVWVDK